MPPEVLPFGGPAKQAGRQSILNRRIILLHREHLTKPALRISRGLGPPDGELVMAISLNASDPKVPFALRH
jgi:hypothetical protein